MTSQPDKLFRDKLENFQRPAPAGAWDKIEHNLARPDKKIIWMRIAAGIALLTAAAIVLWPAREENKQRIVKQDESPVLKKEVPQKIVPENRNEKIINPHVAKTEQHHATKQQPLLLSVPKKDEVKQDQVVTSVPDQQELVAEVIVPEENETTSTTIIYSSAEVNAKFLKKKLPPQATPQPEDASHIQKLIGLAYAAKNSDTGLGDLRQKKDDILALNFGKKKGEN